MIVAGTAQMCDLVRPGLAWKPPRLLCSLTHEFNPELVWTRLSGELMMR